MRLLWICGSRVVGGAERATLQVAGLLRDRGHAVTVACPSDSALGPVLAAAQLPTRPTPLGGALNLGAYAAIRPLLTSTAADVALVTTADEWVWACLSPRPVAGPRLVLARHMTVPLARRVRWLAARRADAVIAVSHAVRESLLGRAGVPPGQLHVIYNPVRFTPRAAVPGAPPRAAARRALGLPADGALVGFFGGLDPNKGVEDVARAVRHANEMRGQTTLLLCGRLNGGLSLAALARAAGGAERLHGLGETERMEEVLTAVDVVVMATHRRLGEALPATLIEAMACGTPVIAYGTGGMREVIGADGEAGRLAAPDDPADLGRVLVEVLGDPIGAERMASAALARARALFDPKQAAERYEQLFTRLCARPR